MSSIPVIDDVGRAADVEFSVAGNPVGQGSMQALPLRAKRGARAVMVYPPHVLEWRKTIQTFARAAMRSRRPLEGPVRMELDFVLKRPQKMPTGRSAPSVYPDLDKLVRAVGDALGGGDAPGICMNDDAQITELLARKRYTEVGEVAGVIIRLWEVGPVQQRLTLDRADEARIVNVSAKARDAETA